MNRREAQRWHDWQHDQDVMDEHERTFGLRMDDEPVVEPCRRGVGLPLLIYVLASGALLIWSAVWWLAVHVLLIGLWMTCVLIADAWRAVRAARFRRDRRRIRRPYS